MEFKDYYQTLGVSKTASDKEMKQAYRKLARKHHPDVNPGDKSAESRFKEINEAYEVLGDADKRRKYDELGANWRQYEQAQQAGQAYPGGSPFGGAGGGAGGPGGAWTINMGGGGPGGYRTMSEEEMHDLFGNEDPFSDFFRTFFGGGGGGGPQEPGGRGRQRAARSQKGRDIEHEVELTMEEAFHGAMRRISIKQGGHARSVDVRIPAGVKEGSRVRAAGEGESGANGGTSGDLYLRVRLKPHPIFERRGNDLHAKVGVPVTTAVVGGEAQVPTMTGPLRLKIPETTQNGQVFRLKGHGMPAVGKPDDRGDLYATVEVQVPRSLTKDQREHYEALKELDKDKSAKAES
jgi:curved DNA-binding protein